MLLFMVHIIHTNGFLFTVIASKLDMIFSFPSFNFYSKLVEVHLVQIQVKNGKHNHISDITFLLPFFSCKLFFQSYTAEKKYAFIKENIKL